MPRHWRVAEIFGPTIQGEGRQAGLPVHFIRFGGCDLRCTWCDTPHAVLPLLISQLAKYNVDDICDQVSRLEAGPEWVVISGGNPATLKLEEVVDELHARGYKVMVETQGTVFNDWLRKVDELCISPKPPSSLNPVTTLQVSEFVSQFSNVQHREMYFKVVVFDEKDYSYATMIRRAFPLFDFFISAGNEDPTLPTVGNPTPDPNALAYREEESTRDIVSDKFKWLAEKVAHDPDMADVRVMPQLHVIAWGNERGR